MKTIQVMRDGRPATQEELEAAVDGRPLPPVTGSPAARPTMVKVLNFDFEVKWVDKDAEDGAQKFGWCNCNTQIIGISSANKPKQLADTFLHEVMHALNWVLGIKDGVKEEEICQRLSSGICCFWIDNPKTLEWWSALLVNNQAELPR